jgi:MFS family permease
MRDPDIYHIKTHEGFEPSTVGSNDQREKGHEYSLAEAVSTITFWLLFAIFAICIFGLGIALTHVVPYAQDMGLSSMISAGILTMIGSCSIVGRIASGTISDKVGSRPVLSVCLIIQTLMMLWLIKSNTIWMFYLFAAFFGISYGGYIVLIPKLTSQIFGLKSMGAIFGGLCVADGLGFATGPLLAGHLFDITGSYDIPFLSVALGMAVAAVLAIVLKEKAAR